MRSVIFVPSCPAGAMRRRSYQDLQSELHLGRGHRRPLSAPEAGLSAMGRLHFPAIPGKSKNPLALTATATSLSASPAFLGAGKREQDYGGLSSRRGRKSREPLSVLSLGTPPERPPESCELRSPCQPLPAPQGPELPAEAGSRRPDVAGSRIATVLSSSELQISPAHSPPPGPGSE